MKAPRCILVLVAITTVACSPGNPQETVQVDVAPVTDAQVEAQRQRFEQIRESQLRAPDPQECKQRGGQLQRGVSIGARPSRQMVCIVAHADGDQECTDSSQCEAGCLVWESDIELGEPAVGACQAKSPIQSGCYAEVRNGVVVGPGLCVN